MELAAFKAHAERGKAGEGVTPPVTYGLHPASLRAASTTTSG
jgi:hypothetical protein